MEKNGSHQYPTVGMNHKTLVAIVLASALIAAALSFGFMQEARTARSTINDRAILQMNKITKFNDRIT